MPTVFSHPAVAIALVPWTKAICVDWKILAVGAFLTVLPDFDVIGLKMGIPYQHILGHRGISHSLFFAVLVSGLFAVPMSRRLGVSRGSLWVYFFLALASHGLLDALTDGGLGVAFFAPFDAQRYFFPVRPIQVSPLDIQRFLHGQGASVMLNELYWVWLPCSGVFLLGWLRSHRLRGRSVEYTDEDN